MKKLFPLTLLAMIISIASYATPLPPITGSASLCLGSTVTLIDSSTTGSSGTWASSNTTVATIGLTSGTVYGVSAGITTITYSSGGSSAYMTFTVNPAPPAPITGITSLCMGATSALSDTTLGGVWSTSNTLVATVSAAGVVYGSYGTGTVTIFYSTGGACDASVLVSINTTPVGSISGIDSVCAAGGTVTLTDTGSSGSGIWTSSNPSIATIGATSGVVTGVTVGATIITYTTTGTCGTASTTLTVYVINTTSPGTISGTATANTGATATLNETVSGGTWSSTNTTVATINPSTGVYTGVSAGTVEIIYAVSGCGGTAYATYSVTVTTINGISGYVNFTGSPYYGNVTVWLVTYNPTIGYLQATDSVSISTYSTSGTSAFYQFLGVATDSYRVKAAVYDSTGVTGYIPTYHTSSFYWYSANVINHTAGTADINEDINMMYGTSTSGPGFVGGYVSAGANRGTGGAGIPVIGMNVNIFNSTTNTLVQATTTDINGYYSFSNLPLGTYYVFPDSLNYQTTAYTSITLSAGADSVSAADFTQHTVSMTITPNTTGVNNVNSLVSSVFAFPNPTNGKLNLQWNETTNEKGNVAITDITGHEIYKTTINMNQGTGVKQLDLSGFVNGLYIISVKSGAINYNTKIQIQH